MEKILFYMFTATLSPYIALDAEAEPRELKAETADVYDA